MMRKLFLYKLKNAINDYFTIYHCDSIRIGEDGRYIFTINSDDGATSDYTFIPRVGDSAGTILADFYTSEFFGYLCKKQQI